MTNLKIIKITSFVLLLICFTVSGQNTFKISGTLSGFDEDAFVKITRENMVLDSCLLKDGKFELKGNLEQSPSSVYLLIKNGEDWIYSSFFIGNETISIRAKKDDFPFSVKTKGSKYDQLRYQFFGLTKDLNLERSNYLQKMQALGSENKWNDSLQNDLWAKSEPLGKIILIDEKLAESQKKFIFENINSYYGLYLLGMSKTQYAKSALSDLISHLNPTFKITREAKAITTYVKNADLNIGERFYDFAAYDSKNKKVKFSDYFDRKYVLLDFSTLYCGFCQQAIPELDKIKLLHSDALEIVTFYVDESQKGFDGLAGKHTKDWNIVWDKQGRFGDTYAKYKVFGTPTFYLFSSKGNLVQKIDGFSEDLAEQIAKAMGR